MNWLLFLYALEVGFCPDVMCIDDQVFPQPIYIQFESEIVLFDHLHISGTARVDMFKDKETYSFCPVSLTSIVDIYYRYDPLSVGARSVCTHPQIPFDVVGLPGQDYNKSYMQVYLRIGNKR